ncbi:MAG: RnfABCDGE type electron transport complex subunit B [Proteobacteria bacterium]|nr:RnfABCDGE type electron transport complex subunit B [Pseudomonadota bacterium]
MITAGIVVGGLGVVAALALGAAAKFFYVEVDPLVMKIEETLPGANCGGCGHPGCSAAAEAIAEGRMPANGCVGGGPNVAIALAAILGVEIKETEPEVAQVGCRYPVRRADVKYVYDGVTDCRAAHLLSGGPKECTVGCLGLGSCVKACPFDALSMGADGLPLVDESKCTGCGTCVRTCPVGIMTLTSVTNRIQKEFTTADCTAPCQRRCPAGINIPEQIRQTAVGNYAQALAVIKERNPLPLICGRICPHPCETDCRRNLVDEPVAINPLKRFVADYERLRGERSQPYKAPATGRKVAVIGGGVEGLSASYFLARLGHQPTLFEGRDKLGGLLRTAIPENRLPRDILDWEIDGIIEMGVEAKTGVAFGRDIRLSELFDQDFEAVLMAVGGWDALLTGGQNPPAEPAFPGLYLLLPLNLAWAGGAEVNIGRHAAVVAGGREALTTARRCLKKGAEKVTIIFSGPLHKIGLSETELDQARRENIDIRTSAQVRRLTGVGDRLTGLAYTMGLSTRLNGIALSDTEGPEHELAVDTVIAATGRLPEMIVHPRPSDPSEEAGEDLKPAGAETPWLTTLPYTRTGGRPHNLFGFTEPVSDYWAAVEAIGAGRRAAASIHKFVLSGQPSWTGGYHDVNQALLDVNRLDNLFPVGIRERMPEAGPIERLDPNREIEQGLSQNAARAEASRCLNCGLICYYRTQYR